MVSSRDLADNAALTVVSRIAMVAASAILPFVGWLLIRSVETVDRIDHKVDVVSEHVAETNSSVKLIQQTQGTQAVILADHEARVRQLEKMARPNN